VAIIIEIIGRNRKALETVTIEGDSVSLGRAYDNQVILHDPYVSPSHAVVEIDETGRLFIRDLNSENGIRDRFNKPLASINAISSGDEFILGKTRIRVLLSNHQVVPALRLSKMDSFLHWIGHPGMVVLLALLLSAVVLVKTYLQTYTAFRLAGQFNTLVALMLLCMSWALFWLLVARISKHDGHFLQQLSVTFLVLAFATGITSIMGWISFNIPGRIAPVVSEYLQWFIVVSVLLWFNLYVALFQSRNKRLFISVGFGVLSVVALLVTDQLGKRDFSSRPTYTSTLLPPSLLVATPVSTKKFIMKSDKVFSSLSTEKNKK
jgi:hypothetical protein